MKVKRYKDPDSGEWREPQYDAEGNCLDCIEAKLREVSRRSFVFGGIAIPSGAIAYSALGGAMTLLAGCFGGGGGGGPNCDNGTGACNYYCLTLTWIGVNPINCYYQCRSCHWYCVVAHHCNCDGGSLSLIAVEAFRDACNG